jgi:arginase
MSRLRAKCPFCKTFTAVAIGRDYECHSCGREFHAGLVRVPQAWGDGGEAMAEAAWLELPFPETAVVEAESLEEQSLALAADLPERPLVLGGCCCSHIGAVEGLAARQDRISLVWFDAHGDLNTPETSPSGNTWGMPLRMLLDSGAVREEDAVLIGARELDPPEEDFLSRSWVGRGVEGIERALDGTGCTYVAVDADVLEPSELHAFMPEPGGPHLAELEGILREVAGRTNVLGAGLTGLTFEPSNVEPMGRLTAALGLRASRD